MESNETNYLIEFCYFLIAMGGFTIMHYFDSNNKKAKEEAPVNALNHLMGYFLIAVPIGLFAHPH